jgi:hypothetical protein
VYVRRSKDQVLDFGHRGWLHEESFLFYDFQTDSLWVQATGEAVHGHYKGTLLDRLPATHTTWSQWRRLHPETKVLGRTNNIDYWQDSYSRYYETGKGIKYERKAPLHFGLAVVLKNEQKLYPFSELDKTTIVQDEVNGEPVLVVFHKPSKTSVAFSRQLEGIPVDFEVLETREDIILRDRPTGSRWSGLTGTCFDGRRKATALPQLNTTVFIVENWPLHYPKGSIYKGAGSSPSAPELRQVQPAAQKSK